MCFINTRKCHVNFYSKKKKSHFSWQYWHLFWLRVCKVVLTLIGPKENYVFHFLVHTSDTFPHLSPPELSMFSLSWAWQPGFLLMALKTVRETPSQKVHRVPICLGKSQNEAGEVQPGLQADSAQPTSLNPLWFRFILAQLQRRRMVRMGGVRSSVS